MHRRVQLLACNTSPGHSKDGLHGVFGSSGLVCALKAVQCPMRTHRMAALGSASQLHEEGWAPAVRHTQWVALGSWSGLQAACTSGPARLDHLPVVTDAEAQAAPASSRVPVTSRPVWMGTAELHRLWVQVETGVGVHSRKARCSRGGMLCA